MEHLDKLLDHCQALEKTISILFKSNSAKEAEVARLHKCIVQETHNSLDELLEQERSNLQELNALKLKKSELDTEVKQFSEINDKLSHLVSLVQRSDKTDNDDDDCRNDEIHFAISETLQEFEQTKMEHKKLADILDQMDEGIKQSAADIANLVDQNQLLVVDLQKNDRLIRLSEQQSKYAEQQFDLIINQLPWEPLTSDYIDQLRKSDHQPIRDLAETLQIQKTEIEDLNEALGYKKRKKLSVLEQLDEELNRFITKRDEAILINRFFEGA